MAEWSKALPLTASCHPPLPRDCANNDNEPLCWRWRMTKSTESTQRELSDEYQHDRVWVAINKSLHPC